MKVRFQADNDLNQILVKAILRREPAIDFQSAFAAGLHRRDDEDVLRLAAAEGRVLVTHDQKTMPHHFAELIQTENSAGVLIVPQKLAVTVAIEDLILIWTASEAEEWINRIRILPL